MATLTVDGDKAIYYEHYAGSPADRWCSSTAGGCRAGSGTPSCRRCSTPDHEVVSLDHRACGSSDKDFADTSIAAIAADVVALVDHLVARPPGAERLVARRRGRRRGGRQARRPARRSGAHVRRHAALRAGRRLSARRDHRRRSTRRWPLLGADRATFLAGLSAAVCHADVGQPVVDWMWQIFMQTSPRADAALRDLGNIDHRSLLPTITAPALVIAGTHDAIVPIGIAQVAAELLPTSTFVEFEASGHAPVPRGERPLPRRARALRRLDLTSPARIRRTR